MERVAANISFGFDRLARNAYVAHMASFPHLNPNPVLEFDPKGKLLFANAAAKNALTVMGSNDGLEQFLPDDFAAIAKMMKGENPLPNVQRDITIKDRTYSEFLHIIRELKVIRVYAIDTTERAQAEKIQQEQQEEIERNYGIIRRSLEGTVQAIASVAEHKDPYTVGHEKRVVEMAVAIGNELGLDKDTLEGLRISATLHDIGKIYIPAEILSKPGKLSDLEFSMIKAHPRYSYEVLSKIEFPWPVADIALQHHERVDGSGYPDGLKKEEIRLEARILAVADVVEAMASHRPYRPALPLSEAMDEIKQGKGKIYDDKVVEAALKIFEKGYQLQ